MPDPKRLLEISADGEERSLLEAGVAEAPSEASIRRAATAIGLGGALGASAVLAAKSVGAASTAAVASGATTGSGAMGSGAAVGGAAVSSSAVSGTATAANTAASAAGVGTAAGVGAGAVKTTLLSATAAKWAGAIVLGGAVTATTVQYATNDSESASEPVKVVHTEPAPAQNEVPRATTPQLQPAAVEEAEEPVAEEAEPQPTPKRRPPASASPSQKSNLAEQVRLVDSARSALAAGNAARSLALLNRYTREYPKGSLHQEVMLLRIEALAAGGKLAQARALARKFLAAQPNSPHAKRIESLVGGLSTK